MKAVIYLHAKFRWAISIHGSDKTTSGFGKRTAAILEFYFRFRFWHDQWHNIFHLPAEFRSNRTIVSRVMTSYRFFKMAAVKSEIYFRVGFRDGISTRYLNPRLRQNYFRFRKTDGRHIGILFPISILTCVLSSASHFTSACQIS